MTNSCLLSFISSFHSFESKFILSFGFKSKDEFKPTYYYWKLLYFCISLLKLRLFCPPVCVKARVNAVEGSAVFEPKMLMNFLYGVGFIYVPGTTPVLIAILWT